MFFTHYFSGTRLNMVRLTLIFLVVLFKTEAQTSVLNIADSLYVYGNYSKAIDYYKQHKNQSEVYDKIAEAYMAIGNYDNALAHYKLGVEAKPKDALLKYDYAKLLYKTKNYKDAAVIFNALVYEDYKNPNYHYELGLALEQINDSAAINRFYNAIELDSTHQKAIYSFAKHYLKTGKNSLVDKYADMGLSTYPNNKELISLKAQNYYVRKQYGYAIVWFEKLLDLNESSQFIHEKLSYAYTRVFEYEKAIEQLLEALKYDNQNSSNLYILGTLYEKIDDFEKAEMYIAKALEIKDVLLDEEYMALGFVLNRQKKHKEAIEAYQKAVKENPNSDRANFYLVYTKDQYYRDVDARINLYEGFKKKFPKSVFISMANHRLKELKNEKFLETN